MPVISPVGISTEELSTFFFVKFYLKHTIFCFTVHLLCNGIERRRKVPPVKYKKCEAENKTGRAEQQECRAEQLPEHEDSPN